MNCPICDEETGMEIGGKPFCITCTSQYPHANLLDEGPNVSHTAPLAFFVGIRNALTISTAVAILFWLLAL